MTVTISIGSGKGGTGKTTIIANLAVLLARTGKKVCLVDLDLGGADVHLLFGQFEPKRTLTDFLNKKIRSIKEVAHTLPSYNGLQIVPGTGYTLQTSNITYQEKQRLLRGLQDIEADILLIDIGAGTSYHALDFFMQSDIQICATLPDPTAIMDLYTFLQLATIRKVLGGFLSQSDVANALKNNNFKSLQEVFDLAEKTSEGSKEKGRQALKYFHPLLIINRDNVNCLVNKAKLRQMVTKYLGIDMPELGEIPEDASINKALKAFMPVAELYPASPASQALEAIAEKMVRLVELFTHYNNPN